MQSVMNPDCEQFTDVYWIKFRLVAYARSHTLHAGLNPQRSNGQLVHRLLFSNEAPSLSASSHHIPNQINSSLRNFGDSWYKSHSKNAPITRVSSHRPIRFEHLQVELTPKRPGVDNRRRI
ncbi:hypothetical protein V6N12_006256 [Hibiscus sabdariffa]|uniref:Uncharacterized protein n=1 Tax=Hibiscus sabdariffa TaxID=183260 RepID=A0ABR2EYA1_9ROSI